MLRHLGSSLMLPYLRGIFNHKNLETWKAGKPGTEFNWFWGKEYFPFGPFHWTDAEHARWNRDRLSDRIYESPEWANWKGSRENLSDKLAPIFLERDAQARKAVTSAVQHMLTEKQKKSLDSLTGKAKTNALANYKKQAAMATKKQGGGKPPVAVNGSYYPAKATNAQAPAPTQKPKPRAKQRARPKAKGAGKGNSVFIDNGTRRFWPLPEVEAPYYVLHLVNVMEIATSSTDDYLATITPFSSLGMGQAAGGSPVYPNPMVDLIAIVKHATLPWNQSVNDPNKIVRCGVIDTPTQTTSRVNTNRRIRCSAINVEITCLGSNGGTYPAGEVYLGKSSLYDAGTRVASNDSLFSSIVQPMTSVKTMRTFTAAELLQRKLVLASCPADFVAYREWNDMSINATTEGWGSNEPHSGMENIYLYIPKLEGTGTIPVVRYRLIINTTWCMRNPSDVLLSSGARLYRPSNPAAWTAHCASLAAMVPHTVLP